MKAKKVSISEDVKISESGYNDTEFDEEGKCFGRIQTYILCYLGVNPLLYSQRAR